MPARKLKPSERRSVKVYVGVTPSEHRVLKKMARKQRQTVAGLIYLTVQVLVHADRISVTAAGLRAAGGRKEPT